LGEPCINIAQVVSDTGENAALTDNLWRSNYILPILKLDRLAHNPLFGSADSSVAPTASKMPWFETGKGLGSPNVVSSYAPYIDAGTHWGCRFSCNNSLNSPYNSIDDFLYPNNAPNAFWELFAKTYGIYKLRGESYDLMLILMYVMLLCRAMSTFITIRTPPTSPRRPLLVKIRPLDAIFGRWTVFL